MKEEDSKMTFTAFPYTIKIQYAKLKDGQCCSIKSDSTGYHFTRCTAKSKVVIDGIPLCGTHARHVKNWRNKIS